MYVSSHLYYPLVTPPRVELEAARGRRKIERIDLKVCGNPCVEVSKNVRKVGCVQSSINNVPRKPYPSISHGQMPTAHGGPSSHVATPQATTYAHTSL